MILDINVYASHNLQQKFHIYKTRPIFHHQIITKNFSFLYLDVFSFTFFLRLFKTLAAYPRRDSIVFNCSSVNEDFFNNPYHTNRRKREKEIRIVAYLWWFKGNLDSRHASLKE